MTLSRQFLTCLLLSTLLLVLRPTVWARDLLKLVPSDTSVCFHAVNLKDRAAAVEQCELARRVLASGFIQQWKSSGDYQRLRDSVAAIESLTNKPLRRTLEELFGRELVLAVTIKPGEAPLNLLLFEVDQPEQLDAALKLWKKLDAATTETKQHSGRDYVRVKPSSGKASYFYTVIDQRVAVSEHEGLVQRAIDLSQDAASSLLQAPEMRPALGRATDDDLFAVYVSPKLLLAKGEPSASDDGAKFIQDIARRSRWLSCRAALKGQELSVAFIVDYDASQTPAWWQRLIEPNGAARLSTEHWPANTVLGMTGQWRSSFLAEAMTHWLAGQKENQDIQRLGRITTGLLLGLDPLKDVLPQLGPAWTVLVVPKVTGKPDDVPFDVVASLDLKPVDKPDQVPVTRALDNTLMSSFSMLAAVHNAKSTKSIAIAQQRELGDATLRWVDAIGWMRPSGIVTSRELILGTSPDACVEFKKSRRSDSDAAVPAKRSTPLPLASDAPNRSQFVLLNVALMRGELVEHRDWLVKQARRGQAPEPEAARRLDELLDLLKVIDAATLSVTAEKDHIESRVTLVAETGKN